MYGSGKNGVKRWVALGAEAQDGEALAQESRNVYVGLAGEQSHDVFSGHRATFDSVVAHHNRRAHDRGQSLNTSPLDVQ